MCVFVCACVCVSFIASPTACTCMRCVSRAVARTNTAQQTITQLQSSEAALRKQCDNYRAQLKIKTVRIQVRALLDIA